ncbi:MAG TPA: hypothetical protein VFT06_00340 [Flavisolibacter sp.]|nr:hypothetical protein [Flavisolibacter sp.]
MKYLFLLLFPLSVNSQSFKDRLPSLVATFLGGASDGARDAFMFRCDNCGSFWNGKQSWLNKYKNRDMAQGPAFFCATSFLAFTTDGVHLANAVTHQFNAFALALAPGAGSKKFGKILLTAIAYNMVRQAGHTLVYEVVFGVR